MSNYERYVDRLFDEDNNDKIYVKDTEGKEIEFEQMGVADFEGGYYAILMPTTKIDGVEEDEVLIFYIDEENDCLVYEEDERKMQGAFDSFCQMIDEEEE